MSHTFTLSTKLGEYKFKTFEKPDKFSIRKRTFIQVKVKKGSSWKDIFYINQLQRQLRSDELWVDELETGFDLLRKVMGENIGSGVILDIIERVAGIYKIKVIRLQSMYGLAKMKDCNIKNSDTLMELISAREKGTSYLNDKGYLPLFEITTHQKMKNYYKRLLKLPITKILNEAPSSGELVHKKTSKKHSYSKLSKEEKEKYHFYLRKWSACASKTSRAARLMCRKDVKKRYKDLDPFKVKLFDTTDLKKRYNNFTLKTMIKTMFHPGQKLTKQQCEDLDIIMKSLRRFQIVGSHDRRRKYRPLTSWFKTIK